MDRFFFGLSIAITLFGLFILASASLGISTYQFGGPYYYFLHQLVYGFLPGLAAIYFTSRLRYSFWKNYSLYILLAAILLTSLVFIKGVGFYYGGAHRWLSFGSISFQPSEFLKLAYVIYLASWLESKSKSISSFRFGFLPFVIMSGFIASFLIMQPDIGTLGVLMASILALFFVSGGSVKQLLGLSGVLALIVGFLIVMEPYRLERVKVFWDPSHDIEGSGYQINQALIAAGSGGFWGRGFGLSRQKFSYLPEPIGDSIFAIVAEELGFIGAAVLLSLFLALFLRGMQISKYAPDDFGKFLACGIMFLIIFQVLINISAIIGLLPLTGIPLSFVSYGGSALAVTMAEIGIVLNISRYRTRG